LLKTITGTVNVFASWRFSDSYKCGPGQKTQYLYINICSRTAIFVSVPVPVLLIA